MGIVNVTPDSFSDGGHYLAADQAIAHGLRLALEGADLVDVGAESTRPGAERVSAHEEKRRLLPVVAGLVQAGVRVSVDTMRAEVAAAAVASGAQMVNDVSGGLADPDMAGTVADLGVPYVAMHWRGHSDRMTRLATYRDVVAEVREELHRRLDALVAAGVREDQIIVDPGLGFAKLPQHDWALLRRLDVLQQLGRPVLVGASRKSFLGRLVEQATGSVRPPAERDALTGAVSALAAAAGCYAVRVHDVRSNRDAVAVAAAWRAH